MAMLPQQCGQLLRRMHYIYNYSGCCTYRQAMLFNNLLRFPSTTPTGEGFLRTHGFHSRMLEHSLIPLPEE